MDGVYENFVTSKQYIKFLEKAKSKFSGEEVISVFCRTFTVCPNDYQKDMDTIREEIMLAGSTTETLSKVKIIAKTRTSVSFVFAIMGDGRSKFLCEMYRGA